MTRFRSVAAPPALGLARFAPTGSAVLTSPCLLDDVLRGGANIATASEEREIAPRAGLLCLEIEVLRLVDGQRLHAGEASLWAIKFTDAAKFNSSIGSGLLMLDAF